MPHDSSGKRVAIVGGGLAGLAAAVALSESGLKVQLFEARLQLGGRAGSFHDDTTDAMVDHCQHVSMGCCTNFSDFCQRTGIGRYFERQSTLHFFAPDGRRFDFRGVAWLPAPFHLAPSLLRMNFLTLRERIGIGRALLKLVRSKPADLDCQTTGQWLRQNRQSENAIRRFWSVVLISALGESLDRSSCAAARKVFLDGFIANQNAYHIQVPKVPLVELYGQVASWLHEHGVDVQPGKPVTSFDIDDRRINELSFAEGSQQHFDYVILAVPWRQLANLVSDTVLPQIVRPSLLEQLGSSPITAVHLWFDRPITKLRHAVLVGCLSQWLFNHGIRKLPGASSDECHAYQVVISASQSLTTRAKEDILNEVLADLTVICDSSVDDAQLIHWQIVTQRHAVFSYVPGLDELRPAQATSIPNLYLAGDWTSTGWPSTMEGAVRSGYLAAERLLLSWGTPQRFLVDDLRRGLVTSLVIRD